MIGPRPETPLTRFAQAVATSLPIGADDAETGDDDAAVVVGLAQDDVLLRVRVRLVRPARRPGRAVGRGEPGRRRRWSRRPGAMRLMRPVRTRPGPISTKVVTPAAVIRSTAADPVDAGREVLDELGAARLGGRRSGGRRRSRGAGRPGRGTSTPASAARIPSAASAMSGECAATETGSTIARLAPSDLASSAPASMAGRSPETTTWPGRVAVGDDEDAVRRGARRPARGGGRRRGR